MYHKILIANRGEIAVRIIRACRELGVRTVAVHSEADAGALHVRLADEAFAIGPAPAAQSYLNIPRLLDVAARSGVDAVHPGYGFLSENAHFASVCRTWGFDFIGPAPETIERMGLKSAARDRMRAAGVPVIPGTEGATTDADAALRTADEIGYPVLVKAAAGGGGRGIRSAGGPEELRTAMESAAREATASFGNGEVYIEKLLVEPRHVEFQVLADRHGTVVHLYERESSMQRRRQKVVEEALSPCLGEDEALRGRMAEAAVAAARAVDYTGAGTVEFLVDADRRFYFIEMNTRIQVEHPTTELVTGIDIVKEQIRVAAGVPLSFGQDDVRPRGWAVECRINAEDPDNRFLPSPGTIAEWAPPAGPWVRIDEGAFAGYSVQPYYDSLLAKLVTWGRDRDEAIRRALRALAEFRVTGVHTTIPMHTRVLQHPDFLEGRYHTRWLEQTLLAGGRVG